MFAFLLVLLRVIVIVCVIGALLTIRKTRLRHIPARQTRVSRHDGESTRWLNGLADSIQDCAACVVRGTANKYAATLNNNNNNSNNDVNTLATENAANAKSQVQLASEIEQSNWLFSCLLLWKRPFHGRRARANYMEFYNLRDVLNSQSDLQEIKAWMQNICIALWQMLMCVFTAFGNYIMHLVYRYYYHQQEGNNNSSNNNSINDESSVSKEVKVESTESKTTKTIADIDNVEKEQESKLKEENNVKDDRDAEKEENEWFRSNKIIALIEERVNATLEDRGIAAWSDFRIHSLGSTLPRVQIVSVKPKTSVETHVSPSTKLRSHSTEHVDIVDVNTSDTQNIINNTSASSSATSHVQDKARLSAVESPIKTNTTIDDNNHSISNSNVDLNSKIDMNNNNKYIIPFELECEAEVEYSGDLDISWRAEICFWRGRRLPLEVRMGAVRLIRCHIFTELEVLMRAPEFINANSDNNSNSGESLTLNGKMWLESNPLFDLQMHTKFSRLGITNCFLIPLLVKYGFLYFVHKYLRRSEKAKGISFNIPLQNEEKQIKN